MIVIIRDSTLLIRSERQKGLMKDIEVIMRVRVINRHWRFQRGKMIANKIVQYWMRFRRFQKDVHGLF